MKKVDVTKTADSCFAKALPDEPVFTLLARDPQAPVLLRKWANDREAKKPDDVIIGGRWTTPPHPDQEQIDNARYCASRMEVWRFEHDGDWRLPTTAAAAAIMPEVKDAREGRISRVASADELMDELSTPCDPPMPRPFDTIADEEPAWMCGIAPEPKEPGWMPPVRHPGAGQGDG